MKPNKKRYKLIISGSQEDIAYGLLETLSHICQEAPAVGYLLYEKLKEWREKDGQIPL